MAKKFKLGPSSIESYNKPFQGSVENSSKAKTVRVRDIVLSPNHPRFKEVGEWAGLGTIFFSSVKNPGLKSPSKTKKMARPYFSNSKFYPLINEVVTIIEGPDFREDGVVSRLDSIPYYFPSMAGWNHPHHNAMPDPVQKGISEADYYKSYNQVENGSVNKPHTQTNSLYLGNNFIDNPYIRGLYPYEGDHILEGRFGNSIRFSSTTTSNYLQNNWSGAGEVGDPITIIRNGTRNSSTSTTPGYLPTIENINDDLSSIYLTSTQQIPIFTSGYRVDSFGENDTTLTFPAQYEGNQILINSGRVILNAKTDGILLSSANVIHLSSGNSIHLDCNNKIVLSTSEIYLGSRNAEEKAVLGKALVRELKEFLVVMDSLSIALTSAVNDNSSLNRVGPRLGEAIKDFQKAIEGDNPQILSDRIKLQ